MRIIKINPTQPPTDIEDFEVTTIEKILSKPKNISNQHLLDTFKLRERGPYLDYLCEVQSTEYKIIPTEKSLKLTPGQIRLKKRSSLHLQSEWVYMIWESTSINRATYVFKTARDSYNMDVQKVFDCIASGQPKKKKKN